MFFFFLQWGNSMSFVFVCDAKEMGQSFVFALDHVEKEFVRVQELAQSNSLEGSTNSMPPILGLDTKSCGKENPANDDDDDDPYAAQARLQTNILFRTLQKVVLPESIRVNIAHIAVLYCIDSNHDGVFSYDDLTNFVKWVYQEVPADVLPEDFAEAVQAKATLRMWKECRQHAESRRHPTTTGETSDNEEQDVGLRDEAPAEAADYFVDWVVRFLERNYPLVVTKATECASTPTTSRTPPPVTSLPGMVAGDERTPAPELPTAPPPVRSPVSCYPPPPTELVPDVFGWDAVECLYLLLNVQDGYGMTIQQFARVLQQNTDTVALKLDTVKQQQLVHVKKSSIVPLLTSFIRSYWRILSRLGLGVLL
jgi:hypothetical protein